MIQSRSLSTSTLPSTLKPTMTSAIWSLTSMSIDANIDVKSHCRCRQDIDIDDVDVKVNVIDGDGHCDGDIDMTNSAVTTLTWRSQRWRRHWIEQNWRTQKQECFESRKISNQNRPSQQKRTGAVIVQCSMIMKHNPWYSCSVHCPVISKSASTSTPTSMWKQTNTKLPRPDWNWIPNSASKEEDCHNIIGTQTMLGQLTIKLLRSRRNM